MGSFWASPGLSGLCMCPDRYHYAPSALGDHCTGSAFAGAVAGTTGGPNSSLGGLLHKLRTGRGSLVSTSLFHSGAWVGQSAWNQALSETAPTFPPVRTGPPDYDKKPVRPPLDCAYKTKDRLWCILSFHRAQREAAALGLCRQLGLPELSERLLQDAFSRLTLAEVKAQLTAPVSVVEWTEPYRMLKLDAAELGPARIRQAHPGMRWGVSLHLPVSLDGSSLHGTVRHTAPLLGVHTSAVKSQPWSPRPPAFQLTPANSLTSAAVGQLPLSGLMVYELRQSHLAVLSCGAVLASLGCTVRSVVFADQPCPALDASVDLGWNHGKQVLELARPGDLLPLLADADALLVGYTESELVGFGLAYEQLRERFPRLVYGWSTFFGRRPGPQYEAVDGEVASFWFRSGVARECAGSGDPDWLPLPPQHFGDNIVGLHMASGITMALLAQCRSQRGQLVEANYLRSGLVSISGLRHPILGYEPSDIMNSEVGLDVVVPTYASYQTKDGYYVQVMGIQLQVELPKLLRALYPNRFHRATTWVKIAWDLVTEVLPSRQRSMLCRVFPLFSYLNTILGERIATLTLAEFEQRCATVGAAWTLVNMIPQAIEEEQVRPNAVVVEVRPGSAVVSSPLTFQAS